MAIRRLRDGAGVVLAVASAPLAMVVAQVTSYLAAVPVSLSAGVAAGVAVSWPRARDWIAWPAALVVAASLAATVATIAMPYDYSVAGGERAGAFGMVEVGGLLFLLALVARWSPPRQVVFAGGAAGLAATVWILRFLPDATPVTMFLACAAWTVGPAGAALVGGYPRLAARRLARSVAAVRRAQRRELAQDLHDFVAHDVTGMVVQAQAARYAAAGDPGKLLVTLERIETVGLRALSALDRMVATLRADEEGSRDQEPTRLGLADIPEVVAGFRSAHPGTTVTFTAPAGDCVDEMPSPVGTTAYRIVVECLTNVRRHAPAAGTVEVRLSVVDSRWLRVQVANDGDDSRTALPRTGMAGGSGLAVLGERVAALGGSLVAGGEGGRWVVRADLPLSGDTRGAVPGARDG